VEVGVGLGVAVGLAVGVVVGATVGVAVDVDKLKASSVQACICGGGGGSLQSRETSMPAEKELSGPIFKVTVTKLPKMSSSSAFVLTPASRSTSSNVTLSLLSEETTMSFPRWTLL
jgi:hypothetical protein